MTRKSFIDRMQPLRERSRLIDWPFPCEGTPPKVRVRILTQDDMEVAHFAAIAHFKSMKAGERPKVTDSPVVAREHTELVWLAFRDPETDEPIAESADKIAEQGAEFITPLYEAWSSFQSELTIRPLTQEAMDELIEHLKKNTDAEVLRVLPSSWLIALTTTLVSRLRASTSSSEPG